MEKNDLSESKMTDKIRHVLTEARVVLPGAQALLGFQFVTVLTDAFDKLEPSSRYLHLAALGCVALSVVLLLAPATYHRIVERGEETEHFHRFASAMVLAAVVPLALGITGDLFVVARRITHHVTLATVLAGASLALMFGLWFGFTGVLRLRQARH